MSRLEDLGRRIAATQDDALVDADHRALVRQRIVESSGARSRKLGPAIVAAVAAAALIVLGVSFRAARRPGLSFTVAEAPASVGAWISASSAATVPVRFSDGTTVSVEASSRVRIAAVDATGARVFLESGSIDVSVVHREKSAWHFVAGPFDVLVTGTTFRLDWDPVTTRFVVSMREGQIVVSGGIAGAGQLVAAREMLVADVSLGRLERRAVADAPLSPSVEAEAVVVAPPAPSTDAPLSPVAKPAPAWRTLAAQGKFGEALAAAEKLGFSSLCATSAVADLYQLGDVARLARSPSRAVEAFSLLRKRFPQDGRAAQAAFALGRLAFDANGAYAEAATWFETYLREQPSGVFAKEAAGRLIEAYHRAGATAAARGAAHRYLAAYPDGPHAQLAKSVLGE